MLLLTSLLSDGPQHSELHQEECKRKPEEAHGSKQGEEIPWLSSALQKCARDTQADSLESKGPSTGTNQSINQSIDQSYMFKHLDT